MRRTQPAPSGDTVSAITARNARPQKSAITGMIVIPSALILAALPYFMIGGLAVQVKEELGLTEAALGAAVTIGFITGSLAAPLGGRLADRIGPKRSIYVGASISAAALLGLGLLADGWSSVVGFLCAGSVGLGLTDPALATLVTRSIPHDLQGLAFGIKEASIPAATLVAGLAVPTIALTVGWRWSFGLGLVPLTAVVVLLPKLAVGDRRTESAPAETVVTEPPPHRMALVLAAFAAALGIAAAAGVGIFITDSAVAMGVSPAGAGLILAIGSVAGVVTRIGTGWRADRTGGPQFRFIAVMLVVGAATMALGSTGHPLLLVVATIGAFSGGWGWTGIFFLSLVKTFPDRPGAVAGIGTAGLGAGNAAGPVLFGLAAESMSHGAAWIGAAVLAAVAAGLMFLVRRMF